MVAKQIIRAASGWLELGMPGDALEELKGLSKEDAESRKVKELKLAAQILQKDWNGGAGTALELCNDAVDEPDFFLSAAFCLHEAGDTKKALDCLDKGPWELQELPVYHYNMACYHWVLGEEKSARDFLSKAIEMDENFKESALVDKDLVGLEM